MRGSTEIRVTPQNRRRVVPGLLQQINIINQAGNAKRWYPVLPGAGKLPWPAKPQVLLRDSESVCSSA